MLLFLYTLVDPEDHPKIEFIYWTYHDDMVRLAMAKLKLANVPNYDIDAEDVVQNAYIKISKYIKKINIQVQHTELRAYLLSIVSNEAADYLKGNTPVEDIDEYADKLYDTEFIDSLQINDEYEKVVRVIQRMDNRYGTTLLYRLRDELSISEISHIMSVPEKTVYTRLHRGTQLLMEMLEKEGMLRK